MNQDELTTKLQDIENLKRIIKKRDVTIFENEHFRSKH